MPAFGRYPAGWTVRSMGEAGRWVAVRGHGVVANADTMDELFELIGDDADVEAIFQVLEDQGLSTSSRARFSYKAFSGQELSPLLRVLVRGPGRKRLDG